MTRLQQPGSKDDIPRNVDELQRWKSGLAFSEHPTVILCGPGNNGGDGLALARTLFNRGHRVHVIAAGPKDSLEKAGPDVRLNAKLLVSLGVEIHPVAQAADLAAAAQTFAATDLIVDALFGTGLMRPLEDPYRALIQAANAAPATRMAVDIPSGLDADTGDVLGMAIRADVTVTFVALKPGFLVKAGPACCGKVQIAEIGIPRTMIDAVAS
jgi:NAD(P)H-hydrate epimerase